MVNLLITFAAAGIIGSLLMKLKVPGGMMVGAIVGAALLNITTARAYMPSEAKLMAQCLAGAFIGCSAKRGDIKGLPALAKPAAILLTAMLCLNIALGTLLYMISPMDLLTSMLCVVPGGMSDVPIFAADLGGDAAKVALMQFVRLIAGIGIFPSLIFEITKNEMPPAGCCEPADAGGADDAKKTARTKVDCGTVNAGDAKEKADVGKMAMHFALTLAVAFACGIFGKRIGIPAGALLMSMLGVMAIKISFDMAYLPMWVKRLAQILSGAYIGCGIAGSDIAELRYMILPAVVILAGYSLNCLAVGHILHSRCGFDLRTAMLAATPAGASDMALISADLGVDSKELVELQIIRLVVVIALFPQIICAIARAVG